MRAKWNPLPSQSLQVWAIEQSAASCTHTADVRIRYSTLFQIAAVLHISADFLRNKTAVTTPDAVTLVFRLCYLNRQMDREQKALSKCFPDHPDLQKHHAAFNRLMEEYLQTKQECAAIAAAKRANQ